MLEVLVGEGHAIWIKKVAGNWVDRTGDAAGTPTVRKSKNASIDQIWARSEFPWIYFKH